MPEPRRDPIALNTMAIFDDAVYFSEALHLAAGQNEEDLWTELTKRAREVGIEDAYHFLCAPAAQNASSATSAASTAGGSERRSLASWRSRETQCTGVTSLSAPSRESRDQVERPGARRMPVKLAQASLSVDNVNTIQENLPVLPGFRQRHSTSSVAQSRSLILAPQRPPMRRQRTSGLFAMFRKGSSTCTSPSHHRHHGRARGPKLECGHSLSTYALHAHIQEAQQSKHQTVPNCCGKPLPRAVLETVLSKEEADIALDTHLQSPDIAPSRDSGYSENGISSIDLASSLSSTSPTPSPLNTPTKQLTQSDMELEYPTTTSIPHHLTPHQKHQLQRISTFENRQRTALQAHLQTSLTSLSTHHQTLKQEKAQQQITLLETLEDSQITLEHDLLSTQALESLNLATALKHMEAYCSNAIPPNASRTHIVTADDHRNLALQRSLQAALPRRHASAVNVLRARQERDMAARAGRLEEEMRWLDGACEEAWKEEVERGRRERERLEGVIRERRGRLFRRWALEAEIMRCRGSDVM